MFPFFRTIAKESFTDRVFSSPHLTANGRKAAERLLGNDNDAISVEKLLNEIGSLRATLEQITNPSSRRSIDL